MVGHFNCGRGVCQGDPLSPRLFCLAEELLSRGTFALVFSHKILRMIGLKGKDFPTHLLYIDDIFVLCSANRKSLTTLMEFLHLYGFISGQ